MKQLLMALAITAFTVAGAEAQTKAKPQEKCSISKDQKYVTCCKTSLNPAYNVKGKTAMHHKKRVHRKAVAQVRKPLKTYYVNTYQVCKDEGGYYTCCLYNNTTTTNPDAQTEW